MFKKSIAALFVGTAVLMTACGGNAATTAPAAEAPAASTETAPETEAPAASTETAPEAAETAASVPAEAAGTEERAAAQIETELTDGVLTIRLDGGPQKDGFYWEYYTGDKGDATFVELITQANDDGCAYAGSFKAIEDAGDAEDYIRLVYTNGTYVYEYTDVNVKIENSQITEKSGGAYVYGVDYKEFADLLAGTWQEENNGTNYLEITLDETDGLDAVISNGGGKDGQTSYYTMTLHFDAIKEALMYVDGKEVTAEITDGEGADTSAAAVSEEAGYGGFVLEVDEETQTVKSIQWADMSGAHEPIVFVKG